MCLLCQTIRCPSMLRTMSTNYRFPFLILKFRRPGRMKPRLGPNRRVRDNYRVFLVSLSIFMYTRDLRW